MGRCLIRGTQYIAVTAVLSEPRLLADGMTDWTALLVDEAAQGIEPEVAIGLSIVAPPEEVSNEKPIFVMAGDQKQLGPRLAFRNGPLEESLFERLFSRKIYAEHPLARSGFIDYGGDKERQDRSLERRRKLLVCPWPLDVLDTDIYSHISGPLFRTLSATTAHIRPSSPSHRWFPIMIHCFPKPSTRMRSKYGTGGAGARACR